MRKWQIQKVRYGEHSDLLDEGFEPFAVVPEIKTNHSTDSGTRQRYMDIHSTDWIYLRKKEK